MGEKEKVVVGKKRKEGRERNSLQASLRLQANAKDCSETFVTAVCVTLAVYSPI